MGFCLKPNEPVAKEITKIVLRQFEMADTELTDIGNPSGDAAIHKARRRVKKIRALIRLVHPGARRRIRPAQQAAPRDDRSARADCRRARSRPRVGSDG